MVPLSPLRPLLPRGERICPLKSPICQVTHQRGNRSGKPWYPACSRKHFQHSSWFSRSGQHLKDLHCLPASLQLPCASTSFVRRAVAPLQRQSCSECTQWRQLTHRWSHYPGFREAFSTSIVTTGPICVLQPGFTLAFGN